MISLVNDYSEGAHPRLLEKIQELNLQANDGYGLDRYCEEAQRLIQRELGVPAAIHFVVGGTQANLTFLSAALRPHEAVISVASGHINVHETGAIEATGHKVLVAEGVAGKLTPQGIRKVVLQHEDEHMVQPRVVYISNATELGGVYTKEELMNLRAVCDEYNLWLYMDGARLGNALCSEENDCTLRDYAHYLDAFTIGGTKNGALMGEAIVLLHPAIQQDFRFLIKQKGGMLAKGFLLGAQFGELFRDGLYFQLALHANKMAMKLQKGLLNAGIPLWMYSTTNLLFPILTATQLAWLEQHATFSIWERRDDDRVTVRLVTSWATDETKIDAFLTALQQREK